MRAYLVVYNNILDRLNFQYTYLVVLVYLMVLIYIVILTYSLRILTYAFNDLCVFYSFDIYNQLFFPNKLVDYWVEFLKLKKVNLVAYTNSFKIDLIRRMLSINKRCLVTYRSREKAEEFWKGA